MDRLSEVVEYVSDKKWAPALKDASNWPPDLFAITSAILGKSGAYRLIVSPNDSQSWPHATTGETWTEMIVRDARLWRCAVRAAPSNNSVHTLLGQLRPRRNTLLSQLDHPDNWEILCCIVSLHALADEACSGLGLRGADGEAADFYLRAGRQLLSSGSLSRFPTSRIRVVPKARTAQAGITLRSLSHNVAIDTSEVNVVWQRRRYPSSIDDERRLRLLVFPWPLVLGACDFRPANGPAIPLDDRLYGFFELHPRYSRDELMDAFRLTLTRALRDLTQIDAIVLPEAAVTEEEFELLWHEASSRGVSVLLGGVRGTRLNEAWLRIRGGHTDETFRQPKHHRWFLEETQIRTYGLGHTLHPSKKWWETMDIGRRSLNVVVFNDWLTLCHLICEDLARIDPVSQSLRSIGPNLIVALLMDGPQLMRRWPGRYATVFADDPGSSVLTVTCLGMARLSRPDGVAPSSVVALWKDSVRGDKEIELQSGATGVVLTLWAEAVEEYTADTRSDGRTADRLVLGGVQQILAY